MLREYKKFPWPLNLWSTVFDRAVGPDQLPKDWAQVLEYVSDSISSPRKWGILLYFFRDGLTLRAIANIYGISQEAVRQHIGSVVRELRRPPLRTFMRLGMEGDRAYLPKPKGMPARQKGEQGPGLIDTLHLSARAWNCLKRAGVNTIDQLVQHTEDELLRLRNMGITCLREIKSRLDARGLTLRVE